MLVQCAPNVDASEAMQTCVQDIGDGGVFFMENATDASRVGKQEVYIGEPDEEGI